MSINETEKPIHCGFIDGTDGYSCNFQGPYKWDRNKPTLAEEAYGVVHQFGGEYEAPHQRCGPAVEHYYEEKAAQNQKPSQDSPEAQSKRYEKMSQEQSKCTKYFPFGSIQKP